MERSRALGSAAVGAGGADGSGRWDSNPRRGSPKDPALAAELLPDAAEGYQTAAGARKWNDANVLALSLRLVSEPLAEEILDAWLDTLYAGSEDASLAVLRDEESRSSR